MVESLSLCDNVLALPQTRLSILHSVIIAVVEQRGGHRMRTRPHDLPALAIRVVRTVRYEQNGLRALR